MIKKILLALCAFALIAFASGCSTVSTEPDEVALHYSGGAFSSKNFKDCVEASNRALDGAGDTHYIYPKGKRTFSFTGAEGSERGPIAVTTGSQEVSVGGFLTFTLNTDCKTLRKFHETIGLKYGAYKDGGGWDDFLNDYIDVPLDATLNEAASAITLPENVTRDQAWQVLYNNPVAQDEFEEFVKENLPEEIEQTLGDDFITVQEVSIKKPNIKEGLLESLSAKEEARLENEAQKEKNEQVRTQYDTIKDCLATGLSESSCTLIFLSQNGADIPFLPVPQGGAINYQNQSAG